MVFAVASTPIWQCPQFEQLTVKTGFTWQFVMYVQFVSSSSNSCVTTFGWQAYSMLRGMPMQALPIHALYPPYTCSCKPPTARVVATLHALLPRWSVTHAIVLNATALLLQLEPNDSQVYTKLCWFEYGAEVRVGAVLHPLKHRHTGA